MINGVPCATFVLDRLQRGLGWLKGERVPVIHQHACIHRSQPAGLIVTGACIVLR